MNPTTTAAPAVTGTRLPATATADPDADVLREIARRVLWLPHRSSTLGAGLARCQRSGTDVGRVGGAAVGGGAQVLFRVGSAGA